MRKIVIIRGPQGSGKSRLVGALQLEGHALSYDMVRQVVSGDSVANDGRMTIPQQHNGLVRALAHESLERRMEDGETIVFEATLPIAKDVRLISEMAARHRYDLLVVDFYATPIDFSKAGNASRPERTRIPDHAVERCYGLAENQVLDEVIRIVSVDASDEDAFADALDAVWTFLNQDCMIRDLSGYARVVHVGDLQGCIEPLLADDSPLAGGLRDDTFYAFVGDLCDRGPDNAGVIRWWLDNAAGRPNVALCRGNHEIHLEREARGDEPVSREFAEETLPQLRAAGITRDDLDRVVGDTVPLLHYVWNGVEVLVSHGGFPRFPTRLAVLPEGVLVKGAGFYQSSIDEYWDAHEATRSEGGPRYQVHGHRNSALRPIRTGGGFSMNLEGQVEFGGHMRFATLDASGWHTHQIRSTRYRSMVQARLIDEAHGRQQHGDAAPISHWAREGRGLVPVATETIAALRAHRMVNEHRSETVEGISSFNFSKEAFFDAHWDEMTTHARGFFVDTVDDTVVARAYQKFFNKDERPETRDEALKETLSDQVDIYAKENGFLGLVGYSERTGDIVVTSKSRIEGKFADMAREALQTLLGDAGMERLLRVVRDQHAACIFEIIHPLDPHIIEEPEMRAVLLDMVRRHETFERMPYEDLVKLGAHLGCETKRRLNHNVADWRALSAISDRVQNDLSWNGGKHIEGVVVEDRKTGFSYKVKGRWYRQWKVARGAVDRIALCRRKDIPFDPARYEHAGDVTGFIAWAQTLPDEALSLDIVRLRNLWLSDPASAESMGPTPTAEKPIDHSGFLLAVDRIAAQIEAGTAKTETVQRMVERAGQDEGRLAAFDDHPRSAKLRQFIEAA